LFALSDRDIHTQRCKRNAGLNSEVENTPEKPALQVVRALLMVIQIGKQHSDPSHPGISFVQDTVAVKPAKLHGVDPEILTRLFFQSGQALPGGQMYVTTPNSGCTS
jgi:hypothetical protein